jgi:ubiquinone biosynthesis protein Coq4
MKTLCSLNAFQKASRYLITHSKASILIPILHVVCKKEENYETYLDSLPNGTLGKATAQLLHKHQLHLIPNYESHDFKHVLLNYEMTPEDEVRMQFFMLGNGNYSFTCLAFLPFGLLLPELWKDFYTHYQWGKQTQPIHQINFKELAHRNVEELRNEWNLFAHRSQASDF